MARCNACKGSKLCQDCGGRGVKGSMKLTCSSCKSNKGKCAQCRGKGFV